MNKANGYFGFLGVRNDTSCTKLKIAKRLFTKKKGGFK